LFVSLIEFGVLVSTSTPNSIKRMNLLIVRGWGRKPDQRMGIPFHVPVNTSVDETDAGNAPDLGALGCLRNAAGLRRESSSNLDRDESKELRSRTGVIIYSEGR
jgi:hypothetical protein